MAKRAETMFDRIYSTARKNWGEPAWSRIGVEAQQEALALVALRVLAGQDAEYVGAWRVREMLNEVHAQIEAMTNTETER
jgi:hypothetical protein